MVTKKKLISGFCANGHHEGTKPKSKKTGLPFPICTCWTTCTCDCHEKVTAMYESLGLPREEAMQNPEYSEWARAERSRFVMPDPVYARIPVHSNIDGVMVHPSNEDPHTGQQDSVLGTLADAAPMPVAPSFGPTPTGRRARGQLEADVLKVCQEFSDGVYEWELCTPKLVSETIGKMYAVEPPSTGAIDAVWNRWEALEFAKRDRKPSHFVGFIGESSFIYLQSLKVQKKRAKKRQIAEQRRGIPRPPASRRK
jgi:hypothetical protein